MGDKAWAAKFLSRIVALDSDGCHIWFGARFNHGYGKWLRGGKFLLAHRVAYELAHGPIPLGLHVLHTCDTPLCVNPKHLYAGTNQDNMRDRDQRGRQYNRSGERNGRAKLTRHAVEVIRQMSEVGFTAPYLAERFGVGTTAIYDVIHGRSWRA